MDIFLVRHGQTDANINDTTQGWLDTELNSMGVEQAHIAANAFDEKIDVIYSSDLKRATQTAFLFKSKYPEVPYYEDSRLRERNLGDASGKPRNTYDWDEFWSSPDDIATIPNSETLNSFNERVSAFIKDIKTTRFNKVLIVAHSGTINRMRHLIAGQDHIQHENGSIVHLELT